jgi:nitrate/TMAO reductase-like tetraheme cytochrome c subunit
MIYRQGLIPNQHGGWPWKGGEMALFINGIIAFILIALGLALVYLWIIRSLAGKEYRISRRSFLYSLAIPAVLGLVFLGVGAFLEYHETAEFCGKLCHSMEGHYEGFIEPENNSMMITHRDEDVTCTGCHVGPGWWGQVEAYLAVPNEFISEIFNTYDLEDLGGGLKEESCIKCHDGDVAVKPGYVVSVTGDLVDPHVGNPECMHCHPAHSAGFGVSLDTCELCHGHALEDWNASMDLHQERTGGECLDCHDRFHPEDARVPWSEVEDVIGMEFCADCHPTEYAVYIDTSTDASLELYGECLDCHLEHLSSDPLHPVDESYADCSECHVDFDGPGGIHNLTRVDYIDHDDVENDLCEACHIEQVEGLDQKPQHRGLDCVFCHVDHRQKVVLFDNCGICHKDVIPDWHKSSGDCTTSSCHGTGWYH